MDEHITINHMSLTQIDQLKMRVTTSHASDTKPFNVTHPFDNSTLRYRIMIRYYQRTYNESVDRSDINTCTDKCHIDSCSNNYKQYHNMFLV